MFKLTFKCLMMSVLIYAQSAFAANLYRCGSSYQDTPCKDAASTKSIKKITQSANQPGQYVDSDCKKRGEDAKKIMWAREVGKTAEQQLEEGTYSSNLISEVYNRRGSSLEVKNAIEQECMKQKEQDKATNALIDALKARGDKNAAAYSPTGKSSAASQEAEQSSQKVSDSGATSSLDDKKNKCAEIKYQADSLAAKRRKGGSPKYMEEWRSELEQSESSMKSLGC